MIPIKTKKGVSVGVYDNSKKKARDVIRKHLRDKHGWEEGEHYVFSHEDSDLGDHLEEALEKGQRSPYELYGEVGNTGKGVDMFSKRIAATKPVEKRKPNIVPTRTTYTKYGTDRS